MIKIKVPLTENVELLNKMKEWCFEHCSRDEFYFFPQKLAIEEPAFFWFESPQDALAFKIKYEKSEEYVDELESIINLDEFKGIVVVPDLHDNIDSLLDVVRKSIAEDLFVLSIGDLSDSKEEGSPLRVVETISVLLNSGKGAFVIGNHDDKYIRLAKGNPVILKDYHRRTLEKTNGRERYFLDLYTQIAEDSASNYYAFFRNYFFCHGAMHKEILNKPSAITSGCKAKLLYGEVNGERDERDFPVRLYNWTNDIPEGMTVFVGHDRKPMGHDLVGKQPVINTNANGGKVFFMDTGSGKKGHLTTAILEFVNGDLSFSRFETF